MMMEISGVESISEGVYKKLHLLNLDQINDGVICAPIVIEENFVNSLIFVLMNDGLISLLMSRVRMKQVVKVDDITEILIIGINGTILLSLS